jgi:hypothetical protein
MTHSSRCLLGVAALAATAGIDASEPKVYALVGAVGNRVEVVHEVQSVGSNLPPFRRSAYAVNDNIVNRLVLQGLDQAVEKSDPGSKRVYLSTNPVPSTIERVVEDLRKMDRSQWDRILVALPSYRSMGNDGLPIRIQGLTIFVQPLGQGGSSWGDDRITPGTHGVRPISGPQALTPDGEVIAANTFVAPYSFIEVFILDAKTLAVLKRNVSHGHRKLTDNTASARRIFDGSNPEFLASQVIEVIHGAVEEAVLGTHLKGKVDVLEKGPVRE